MHHFLYKLEKVKLLKIVLSIVGVLLLLSGGFFIYQGYLAYVNPEKIYGTWVEVKVMDDRRDELRFSATGVYLNDHLISTRFRFNGKKVQFRTGARVTVYRLTGTPKLPKMKRIEPAKPLQVLVRKGYEHLVEDDDDTVRIKPGYFLSDSELERHP
jgi:hypothetical protein